VYIGGYEGVGRRSIHIICLRVCIAVRIAYGQHIGVRIVDEQHIGVRIVDEQHIGVRVAYGQHTRTEETSEGLVYIGGPYLLTPSYLFIGSHIHRRNRVKESMYTRPYEGIGLRSLHMRVLGVCGAPEYAQKCVWESGKCRGVCLYGCSYSMVCRRCVLLCVLQCVAVGVAVCVAVCVAHVVSHVMVCIGVCIGIRIEACTGM